MKFLITATLRVGVDPVQVTIEQMEKAVGVLEQMKAKGTIICSVVRVDGSGMTVAEAGSAEEMWDALDAWPYSSHVNWQIEPVLDTVTSIRRRIEKAKAHK